MAMRSGAGDLPGSKAWRADEENPVDSHAGAEEIAASSSVLTRDTTKNSCPTMSERAHFSGLPHSHVSDVAPTARTKSWRPLGEILVRA
jgi:hypothetical protein